MDREHRSQIIAKLKATLVRRGVNPEPYIKALMAFQSLIDSAQSHTDIETIALVVQALGASIMMKHDQFHDMGGQDERASSSLN